MDTDYTAGQHISGKFTMRTLWERLTTPSDSIQNPEQRQHAYLLASLLVLLVPLFIIPEAIRTLATGQAISFFWLSTTLFIISYGLSRTRHYRVGIAVVLATLGVMPIVSILSRNHAPEELLTTLIWMIPNVVVGSLLLSVRGTAVYVLLNIASVFLLLLVVPGATLAHLAFPLGFITAVFIPLLAVTAVRQQYLNQIKNQSTELAHSEEQFRALVEHSHAAILLIGDDYRFIYVNERACDIFGYSRDELIDLDFRVLLDDESREHVADRYRRRKAGEDVPARYEFNIVRKNGEKRWVEIRASTYTNLHGQLQIISQLLDITERKQTEEALRNSEALYQSLVNSLPQNIFRKDVDGRFTFANEHFCRAQGKSLSEIIGKTDNDFHPPEMALKYRADDQKVMETGKTFETIESFHLLDGQKSFVQIVKTPTYDAAGRLTGIQGIFWDITEYKKAQEALQKAHDDLEKRIRERTRELATANTRLKELDKIKNQFIEDMSHELRTPLANLSLYLDLLELGASEKRLQYRAALRQATNRLIHLSEDIITVTRLNLYKDDIQFTPLDLNQLVADILLKFQHRASDAGIILTYEPQDSLPLILTEREQLQQVITNLLQNSLNFTRQGHIQVSTHQDRAGRQVCLQVADTGVGIPEDELPYLFDRFYRGRQVGQSTLPGSGLGLALVKEIVEMHGGRVAVASEEGKGAVFRVWLPTASTPET